MVNWKYTKRKINGKTRRVKVRKLQDGRVRVRVVGYRNTVDGPRRKKR